MYRMNRFKQSRLNAPTLSHLIGLPQKGGDFLAGIKQIQNIKPGDGCPEVDLGQEASMAFLTGSIDSNRQLFAEAVTLYMNLIPVEQRVKALEDLQKFNQKYKLDMELTIPEGYTQPPPTTEPTHSLAETPIEHLIMVTEPLPKSESSLPPIPVDTPQEWAMTFAPPGVFDCADTPSLSVGLNYQPESPLEALAILFTTLGPGQTGELLKLAEKDAKLSKEFEKFGSLGNAALGKINKPLPIPDTAIDTTKAHATLGVMLILAGLAMAYFVGKHEGTHDKANGVGKELDETKVTHTSGLSFKLPFLEYKNDITIEKTFKEKGEKEPEGKALDSTVAGDPDGPTKSPSDQTDAKEPSKNEDDGNKVNAKDDPDGAKNSDFQEKLDKNAGKVKGATMHYLEAETPFGAIQGSIAQKEQALAELAHTVHIAPNPDLERVTSGLVMIGMGQPPVFTVSVPKKPIFPDDQ